MLYMTEKGNSKLKMRFNSSITCRRIGVHNLKRHCFSPYKTLLQRTHHIHVQSTVDMIL